MCMVRVQVKNSFGKVLLHFYLGSGDGTYDVRLTQQAHTFPLSHLASLYVDFC